MRDALSVDYLIKAIHRAQNSPGAVLSGHYSVFSGPDVCLMRDGRQSQQRDFAWELLVAALCAGFASDVALKDPDVLCRYEDSVWGVACKVLYSHDPDQHIDQIIAGAKQIERDACDLGIVAVNATNLIPHDKFIREMPDSPGSFLSFRDPQLAIAGLGAELRQITEDVNRRKTLDRLSADKNGVPRWKTRAVFLFAQTVAFVGRVPTILSMVNWWQFRAVAGAEAAFLQAFNHSAQTVATHVLEV